MSSNMMLEKIVSLCKRRGFVYPGSEIYGGLANSWDYGPLGVELKNNIKQAWWKRFVQTREDMVGLDAAIILNPKVWLSSGHVDHFIDPLVECKNCHTRFRQDLVEGNICPVCGEVSAFTEAKMFNLMFKTFIGPSEESANVAYLRPETAQAIFVDFKQVVDSTRVKIPFGIAQIGKAFRNEITPGNFIFRTREFEQMEIEYFIKPPENEKQWQEYFEHWRQQVLEWLTVDLGLEIDKIHQFDVPEGERAHYSQKTIDFEYDFPFGRKELYGLAYRTDFDLKNHAQHSGQNLNFRDPETGEEYLPHVIEPSFGLDRSILAVLLNGYQEVAGKRLVLKINPKLAPYKAAVFPLLANKPRLHGLAKKIYLDLKLKFMVAWDERGNIGKRYASQDEIGTPFCITIDFQSLEDNTVTVRLRDSAKQDRVAIDSLTNFLHENI